MFIILVGQKDYSFYGFWDREGCFELLVSFVEATKHRFNNKIPELLPQTVLIGT